MTKNYGPTQYRIIPFSDLTWGVQSKWVGGWRTVKTFVNEDSWNKTFPSEQDAERWIEQELRFEIKRMAHMSIPPRVYPNE